MTDTETTARAAALWSWCYRASPGQSMVAAAKLTDAELQECIDAAERLKGWAHLRQMVLRRQELTIKATQHCTSEECGYTFSHTASWCHYDQPRRCGCAFCYPDEVAV